jgi:Transposase DDE domain group 1
VPTECPPTLFEFARVQGRAVVASFDGGRIASDAGALLLGAADQVIGLTRRLAACFADARQPAFVEPSVETLVMQRVVGIALGYEDLADHDHLRHDPVMATLVGKLAARRRDCAPLAGKSTLNRMELSRPEPSRHARLAADPEAIEALFVDLFLDAHRVAPKQITLDLDATDDPLHGHQEAGSSTATMIATAACRSTCFVAATGSRPSCGARTLTPRPERSRRWRGVWRAFAHAGRGCASCYGVIAALPARP